MPVLMSVLRGALSTLRFCQTASASALGAAQCSLSQPRFRAARHLDAIGLPQIFGSADQVLDSSKNPASPVKISPRKNPLVALSVAVVAMSAALAGAQTTS